MRLKFHRFFPGVSKKTHTSQIYHWIKSVARLELKAISPCFSVKFKNTHTANLASLNCKTFRNKGDHLYRITTIFWSYIVYHLGNIYTSQRDPPWISLLLQVRIKFWLPSERETVNNKLCDRSLFRSYARIKSSSLANLYHKCCILIHHE